MALRAREIYYFVRVGNYASRPLRALTADMNNLGRAGDSAANRMERLQLQQRRLQSQIARRVESIPIQRQGNLLREAERRNAIDRASAALANRRLGINQRIVQSERQIDAAINRGNILASERTALEQRQLSVQARNRAALTAQQAQLAIRQKTVQLNEKLLKDEGALLRLERSRAVAQRTAVLSKGGLTAPQRQAALEGRISRSGDVAKAQAAFLGAEKSVRRADLALQRFKITEATAGERAAILAAQVEKLAAAEQGLAADVMRDQNALARSSEGMAQNAASVERYRAEVQLLTANLQALQTEDVRLTLAERRLIGERYKAALAVAKENAALQEQVGELGRVAIAMESAARAQNRLDWRKIGLAGRAISDLGRTAQYAGAIVVASLGFMAKSAADFQTQATLAATQVTSRFREIGPVSVRIQKGILDQMRRFPAASKEMTAAAYDIFSTLTLTGNAAQRTATGMKVMNVFNRAAVAGQADLADVTKAGITILNDFGTASVNSGRGIRQLNKFMDRAFAAVRFGRMTFQEFTTTLANAAPAAKAANQSFSNMAGTLAFLTRRMPVRQAAVSYARLLEVLQRARQGLAERGVRVRDPITGHMRQLDQIIGDIVKKFPNLARGKRFITDFFKSVTAGTGSGTIATIQARRAFTFLIRQYEAYQQILHQTTGDQGEFNKSFRALSQSAGVRFRVFVNNLKEVALVIGADAIPALMKLLNPIIRVARWFDNLSNKTKDQIATLGAFSGAALLLSGTAAILLGSLIRMGRGFVIVGKAMRDAMIMMGLMEGEIAVLQPELLIGVGVLVAAAAFIRWRKQIDHVANRLRFLKGIVLNLWPVRFIRDVIHAAIQLGKLGAAAFNAARRVRNAAHNIGNSIPFIQRAVKWVQHLIHYWHVLANLKPVKLVVTIVGNYGGKAAGFLEHFFGKLYQYSGYTNPLNDLMLLAGKTTDALNKVGRVGEKAIHISRTFGRQQQHDITDVRHARVLHNQTEQRTRAIISGAAALGRSAVQTHQNVVYQGRHNKAIQHWIRLLIQANRYALAHPHDFQAQLRLARLQAEAAKKFKGAELDAIQSVVSADEAGTKKQISNAKRRAKAIAAAAKQAADEAVSNMRQIYDQFQSQNESLMGDITQGVRTQDALQFGVSPGPGAMISDLKDQIRRFRTFRSELEQLGRRGVPFALIQQLEQAGMQAEPLARTLLHMNRRQFNQYVGLFRQSQAAINKATQQDFNMQLNDWRSHGRNAALAFMRGMGDEKNYINRQMRKIFLSWLHGGNATLGTVTNPGPHHHHAGHHRAATHHNPRPTRTHPRTLSGTHQPTTTEIHHHHDTINIKDHGEDLSTKLRKARLHQKHRRMAT